MAEKRSLTIAGHRTSVSLEDPFWAHLKRMAGARGISLADLVGDIDRTRGARNLSSALRLAVLADLEARDLNAPAAPARV